MKLTVLLSLLTALPLVAADSSPDIVARIGDVQVNAAEVRATIAALGPQESGAVSRDPALLNQVVRSLLVQRLLLKEAGDKAHGDDPAVAAKLARAREVALTESYLAAVSEPPTSYPNDAELKAAYEKARPSIGIPKSWRLAQIFVPLSKDADKNAGEKAQAKLEAVRKLLKTPGVSFAEIAAQQSEEPASAANGGEIGWLAETQIQAGIREKLAALKVEGISEPIRLDDGWHIVKVLDTREPYTPALEQVRTQLVSKLREEKTRANSQAYVAKLLQDHPPAINEIALGQIVAPQKKN